MNKTIKGCMGCLGIFIASMVILFVGSYIYYKWIWEEWPVERIERITGAKVPKFTIIERHEGERHFTGDHLDTIRIEFESIPSDELFEKIDSMIASNSTKWEKKDSSYSYSTFWGNGCPAPEGESEAADGIFMITLIKGSKFGEIVDGTW
jgi:hypothetical protein